MHHICISYEDVDADLQNPCSLGKTEYLVIHLLTKHYVNGGIRLDCINLTNFQIVMKYVNACSVIFEAFTDKKFHL